MISEFPQMKFSLARFCTSDSLIASVMRRTFKLSREEGGHLCSEETIKGMALQMVEKIAAGPLFAVNPS